jgi:hypothetical protein
VTSESQGSRPYPLEIETVECSPQTGDNVLVCLTGNWGSRRRAPEREALLLVEAEGERHRFPPLPEQRRPRIGRAGEWSSSYVLPAWLAPPLAGPMSITIGNLAVPLPEPVDAGLPVDSTNDSHAEPDEPAVEPDDEPTLVVGEEPDEEPAVPEQIASDAPEDPVEFHSSLTDEGDETVVALRAELRQRAAAEGQLRGELANAQAQLDVRAGNQARLEAAQEDLRRELDELQELVQQRAEAEALALAMEQRVAGLERELETMTRSRDQLSAQLAELRMELAASVVAREASSSEATGMRGELDRLRADLAAAGEELGRRSELRDAEVLLAEARALNKRMRDSRDEVATASTESS